MTSLKKHLSNAAKARWKKTSPEERTAIAKRNAAIRWAKYRAQQTANVSEKEIPEIPPETVV